MKQSLEQRHASYMAAMCETAAVLLRNPADPLRLERLIIWRDYYEAARQVRRQLVRYAQ